MFQPKLTSSSNLINQLVMIYQLFIRTNNNIHLTQKFFNLPDRPTQNTRTADPTGVQCSIFPEINETPSQRVVRRTRNAAINFKFGGSPLRDYSRFPRVGTGSSAERPTVNVFQRLFRAELVGLR